ncbi:MAG: FtsX-like permease family protein, partial [Stackebrandtia sp.]
ALGYLVFEVAVRVLVASRFVEDLTSGNLSFFAQEVQPDPVLAAIVIIAIPVVSIIATQLSMRRLVVEPLGVVRQAKPSRRRLWWRLLLVIAGLAALVPTIMDSEYAQGDTARILVAVGILVLLLGMAAILPWAVETLVARMRGGAPSWQLATRRLQLGGGGAARAIIGIAVAVAGAVSLQLMFAAVENDEVSYTGMPANQAELNGSGIGAKEVAEGAEDIDGITVDSFHVQLDAYTDENDYGIMVADCDQLKELADIDSCAAGDVFGVDNSEQDAPKAGEKLGVWTSAGYYGEASELSWTVPKVSDTVAMSKKTVDTEYVSMLVTPEALGDKIMEAAPQTVIVNVDPGKPDAVEKLRNYAAQQSPQWYANSYSSEEVSSTFAKLRNALYVGVIATMMLIGLSLLVSTVEQLQERRRLMSVLVAFGTRRRSLVFSVLWQTAIPVVCGLVIATGTGIGLGSILVSLVGEKFTVDWPGVLTINAAGAAMVVLVTLLSFPPLWRMMRPDGIRTELEFVTLPHFLLRDGRGQSYELPMATGVVGGVANAGS